MRSMTQSQIAAALKIGMQFLHDQQGGSSDVSLNTLFRLSDAELLRWEGQVKRLLWTHDYRDAGWNRETPACFGNLCRYALVKKARNGIRTEASAYSWRRMLKDCSDWPLDTNGFRACFDRYLEDMESEISAKTHRNLSPASINRFIAMVSSVWSVGVWLELAEFNPVSRQRYPKGRCKPRKRTLSTKDISKLMSALRRGHEGLYWAFCFCIKNPIGYGDLIRLECDNVNLEERVVSYARRKTDAEACPIIYDELVEYCKRRVMSGEKYLFDLPHDYRYSFKKAMAGAGVTDLKWHDLRHHSATWLVTKGVPLHIVASIGGWSTTQMVERYHDLQAKAAAAFVKGKLIEGPWNALEVVEKDREEVAIDDPNQCCLAI